MDRVRAYLVTQESALVAGEAALHAGDRSAVHRTRVAARRARSTLRTFAPFFLAEPRDGAIRSLREYAARLGAVRDLQVLREAVAAHTDAGLRDWTLREWALREIDTQLDAAWPLVARTVRPTPATSLGALPPAPRSRATTQEDCAARAARRVDRRLARAGDDPDRLHEVRKAAKRARYAAEALAAQTEARRFEAVQEALGGHRDLLIAAAWLEARAPSTVHRAALEVAARLRADAADVRGGVVL